jgi:MFS family permease
MTKSAEQGKPSLKFLIMYALAYFGAWCALLAPTMASLALRVGEINPAGKEKSLALVLAVGAICALIANPIFGRLSDNTGSRLGRRRPWIIGGVLAGTAGLFAMSLAEDIITLTIIWSLVQIVYNAAVSAIAAVLADQIAPKYRGIASAATGIGGSFGMLAGVALVSLFSGSTMMFIVPATVGGALVLAFALTMRDKRVPKKVAKENVIKAVASSFTFHPLKSLDYTKILISRFLIFIGIAMITNYQIYFMQDKLGYMDDKVAQMVVVVYAIAIVFGILGNAISGKLSDKFGRRKIFISTSVLAFAAAVLFLAFNTQFWILAIVVAVLGFANGAFTTISFVVTSIVMPDQKQAGKWLGIANISATLPQSIAPAIAPIFLSIGVIAGGVGNYTALFIGAAVISVLGVFFSQSVRGVK